MTEGKDLPVLDFNTFIQSLAHAALMHLGDAPHPESQAVERNLPLAKQTIDLIGMLEEKTRGNLVGEEERLLEHILFDLRMRYVELTKADKK